ncbi:hypothetical protein [Streptomyces sp. RerS4]|uniref:hypothetical protein n=1 Tax=Streptomyces sp. RerS4 TaxID=2942449 RepID=UPI00201C58FC|nr:hypothetical protein [Streptomyces sp. RerS4]UQX05303.1 hypothetical protein M4D82_32990 [Streptomyces sp. RerS4]
MVLLLLVLVPAAVVGMCVLVGYGLTGLGRAAFRRGGPEGWLRGFAGLLGGFAVACYAWGLLHVVGAVLGAEDGGTSSSPLIPCRTPGQEERAATVIDYTVAYVPLRFVCETTGGGSYAAESVPAYVNPAVFGLAVGAAVCRGAVGVLAGRRDGGGGRGR